MLSKRHSKTSDNIELNGILLIDKPHGPTSHDVVQIVKTLLNAKKVGHLGTLDPTATGILPLLINKATRYASIFMDSIKEYEFDIVLGYATETDDETGKIIAQSEYKDNAKQLLKEILPLYFGEIMQIPPLYSAVKIGGVPMYKMARKGKKIFPSPRPVKIYKLYLCEDAHQDEKDMQMRFRLRMICSAGTYVRALCRDIGMKLGLFGHAANIRRLKSGPFSVDDAVPLCKFRILPFDQKKQLIISLKDERFFLRKHLFTK